MTTTTSCCLSLVGHFDFSVFTGSFYFFRRTASAPGAVGLLCRELLCGAAGCVAGLNLSWFFRGEMEESPMPLHFLALGRALRFLATISLVLFFGALCANGASYDNLRLPKRRRRTTTPSAVLIKSYDPDRDRIVLSDDGRSEALDCSSQSPEQWATQASIELADFATAAEKDPSLITPSLQVSLDKTVLGIAQQYFCAVKRQPSNVAYLQGFANSLTRSSKQKHQHIAMSMLLRAHSVSSFENFDVMWYECQLLNRLNGPQAARRCFNKILKAKCSSASECRSQATALARMSETELEIAALQHAFRFDPEEPTTNIKLLQLYILSAGSNDTHFRKYRQHRQQFVTNVDLIKVSDKAQEAHLNKRNVNNGDVAMERADIQFSLDTTLDSILFAAQSRDTDSPPVAWSPRGMIQQVAARGKALDDYRQLQANSIRNSGLCGYLRSGSEGNDSDPHAFGKLLIHLMLNLAKVGTLNITDFPILLHEAYLGPPLNGTHFHLLWGESDKDLDLSKYDYPLRAIRVAQALCQRAEDTSATMAHVSSSRSADGAFLSSVYLMDRLGTVERVVTDSLEDLRADIRAVDSFGMNAIQYAVINGDAQMMQTLLSFTSEGPAVDVHARDMWGNSAASMIAALPEGVPLFNHFKFLLQAYEAVSANCFPFSAASCAQSTVLQILEDREARFLTESGATRTQQTIPTQQEPGGAEEHCNSESLGTEKVCRNEKPPHRSATSSTAGAVGWTTTAQTKETTTTDDTAEEQPSGQEFVAVVDAYNTSLAEVVRHYVAAGRPVIIRNALGRCESGLRGFSRDALADSQMAQLRFRVIDGQDRTMKLLGDFIRDCMPRVEDAPNTTQWTQEICDNNKYIAQHFEAGWKRSPLNKLGTEPPPRMEPVSSVLDCLPRSLQEYFQLVVRAEADCFFPCHRIE